MSQQQSVVLLCVVFGLISCAYGRGPTLSRPAGGDEVQPLELLHVYGCEGSSTPRRDTFGCKPDGASRLTIRGRQFQSGGNSVVLQESLDATVGSKKAGKSSNERLKFECEQLRSSPQLPSLLLICTIPSKDAILAANGLVGADVQPDRLPQGNIWFDVKVSSGWGSAAAVLRRSVQVKFGGGVDGSSSTSGVPEGSTEALDALRRNDWQSLGIGGLGKPIQELFRRAFSTRSSVSAAISGVIGVPHVKGIILHGPPGTGKTLLARTVAKLLNAKNVQVVNGPEIMSKFVGDSEKNLRTLFAPSEEDFSRNGAAAGLHVIIFDEVDAILRPRGEGDDSAARAVYDGVTTQMLAAMDGIHTRSNLLIIGLTNRLDSLDKALLRPGRFEVQIRVPLPDEEGRLQIFSVHTKPLKVHRYLSPRVNFPKLAADTSSFSGADIAGVVRSAISFALERFQNETISVAEAEEARTNLEDPKNSPSEATSATAEPCFADEDSTVEARCHLPPQGEPPVYRSPTFLVEERDLQEGIREILATKGAASNMAPYLRNGVVLGSGSTSHRHVLTRLVELMALLQTSRLRQLTVSLYGPPGSGTTALAALAARMSRASYTQLVTINSLDGLSVNEKIRRLSQAFDTAAHVPSSFIVLDKLEDLLEMNMGRRPHDRLATELIQMVQRDDVATGRASEKDAKRLVLVVTSRKDLAAQFGSITFDASLSLDPLTVAATEQFLCAYGVARNQTLARRIAQSNIPAALPLKRLIFLVHAAAAAVSDVEDTTEEPVAAEAGRPIAGDVAAALFSSDIAPATSLCREGEETKQEASTRARFLKTVRDFGHAPSSQNRVGKQLDL